MADIFDHTVLCKVCNKPMEKVTVTRNGFKLRMFVCSKGHDKVVHPADLEEYKKFKELKDKEFKVKMRLVGNSYTVSIPKEIVSFIREQERTINDMVKLCFEDVGRISLTFDEMLGGEKK